MERHGAILLVHNKALVLCVRARVIGNDGGERALLLHAILDPLAYALDTSVILELRILCRIGQRVIRRQRTWLRGGRDDDELDTTRHYRLRRVCCGVAHGRMHAPWRSAAPTWRSVWLCARCMCEWRGCMRTSAPDARRTAARGGSRVSTQRRQTTNTVLATD